MSLPSPPGEGGQMKYWERRELHDRHAKALDKSSAAARDKVAMRVSEIMWEAVQRFNGKERKA